jgi:hypothetical protein
MEWDQTSADGTEKKMQGFVRLEELDRHISYLKIEKF